MDEFVSLAEIAGVFVGFGALIGLVRPEAHDEKDLQRIGNVVSTGLLVLATALFPVLADRYGLTARALWTLSSAVFLGSIWFYHLFPLFSKPTREAAFDAWKSNLAMTLLIWVLFEIPVQLLLILAILDFLTELSPAFYMTGLVFNLFKAATILGQVLLRNQPAE